MNGCGESVWPNWPAKPEGVTRNTAPSSWPRKNSVLIGPNQPRKLGSFNGATRFTRNILLIGAALSLNIIGPPSPGPHHKLCFPYENCQFDHVIPTYASSNLNCVTEG